jgi:hypothetical protein
MAADLAAFRCARIGRDAHNYLNEYQIAERIDFGFQWLHPEAANMVIMSRPRVPMVSVLKLHGSTNWLRCPLCDNIYVNPWGPIWVQAFKAATDTSNVCHCSSTRLEVQIVSPSYVREMREPNLLSIWKSALDELRAADEWLIVGYSFPDEDLAVRALFTRAYGSREHRPHITVVQRDEAAFSRYDAFFAPEALTYCVGGLEGFLGEWRRRAARQKRVRRHAKVRRGAKR